MTRRRPFHRQQPASSMKPDGIGFMERGLRGRTVHRSSEEAGTTQRESDGWVESYPYRFRLYLTRYVLFTIICTYDALYCCPVIFRQGYAPHSEWSHNQEMMALRRTGICIA